MSIKVNEIFYSIQGESSYTGRPCVFVRLTGCNLRCSYCDTRYAYEEGRDMEISEIVDVVASYQCRLVEVTGGEPLIQHDTPFLITSFLERDYEVLLETNGSQDISLIDERCVRIVDIKCPSSGEDEKNDLENLERLTDRDEIKFVIGGREDYEYARTILEIIQCKSSRMSLPHLSPVFGQMIPHVLAQWILEDCLDVRLNLQLHKIIWDPEKRGV
ncbi:MAG: radical SAM protein [Deltaproteobacteria bacterium]|nr:radical SAM protein [Deltaproteobacteria bacterium]